VRATIEDITEKQSVKVIGLERQIRLLKESQADLRKAADIGHTWATRSIAIWQSESSITNQMGNGIAAYV